MQFCTIRLSLGREYSLIHFRIHLAPLSALTSSINTSDAVPCLLVWQPHNITLPPPYVRDDVVCFCSWPVSILLHIFFIPQQADSTWKESLCSEDTGNSSLRLSIIQWIWISAQLIIQQNKCILGEQYPDSHDAESTCLILCIPCWTS